MKPSRRTVNPPSSPATPRVSANARRPGAKPFPIVGVGASAGGLEAFTQLLTHIPKKSDMAFVLVQHLAPLHESALSELLRRATKLAITEVKDGEVVKPDCVYVIPPNVNMGILDGRLHLIPRATTQPHLPIDFLLRSLADERGNNAIGVVLSGTASDGSLGIKAIKGGGGITFAQDPASAKYRDMPRNAIATGCVDFVLPPDGIARELIRLAHHPYLREASQRETPELFHQSEGGMRKIFILLRTATGVDFSDYKHTTIKRRIKRRMMLHKDQNLKAYIDRLQEDGKEVEALYQDILIHVTGFFRDPEVFEALKTKVFPKLFENRRAQDLFRVWVPGCSSGEEVYSIAICLMESLANHHKVPEIQIFATDLADTALQRARAGVYLENISAEVSPERLRRFFTKVSRGYQIVKSIRDVCVFARQDITRDPPFSRVDLISCRNLLIYLGSILHKRVFPILHYALKPDGYLLLGSSETVGTFAELFSVVDKKNKIYAKKPSRVRALFDFAGGSQAMERRDIEKQDGEKGEKEETPAATGSGESRFDVQKEADRVLLNHYAPAGVLVNSAMEIMQFRGRTGNYLEPAAGQPSLSLMRMAREGLLVELRQTIERARKDDAPYKKRGIAARIGGRVAEINIEVIPIKGPALTDRCYLVMFEEVPAVKPEGKKSRHLPAHRSLARQRAEAQRSERLKIELAQTKTTLQSIIEEQETTNEELKSANEEILSSNEELQSTNEEMETAKEELQSTNEELNTLNDELRGRNVELASANNDLLNLLASVNIPILMLGTDLRIRHFTPPAENLLNLIPADIGRPIGDLKLNLDVHDLEKSISAAIENYSVQNIELRDRQGRWYSTHIRPYRTADNKLDGAVVTWIDITALKTTLEGTEKALNEASEQYRLLFERNLAGVFRAEVNGNILQCNSAFVRMFGYSSTQEALHSKTAELYCSPGHVREMISRMTTPQETSNIETQLCQKDGTPIWVLMNAAVIQMDKDSPREIEGIVLDISRRRQAEEALHQLSTRLLESQEEERKRISQELHGTTAANLTATIANLASAMKNPQGLDKRVRGLMAESLRLTKRSLKEIRTLSYLLHPPLLDELGLSSALHWYVDGFVKRSGIKVDLACPAEMVRMPKEVESTLFRLVQESLSNIHFHSQSPTAQIRVSPADGHVDLEVSDVGIGVSASAKDAENRTGKFRPGVGIASMRERTLQLGGKFDVTSDGKGTTVRATLPLQK